MILARCPHCGTTFRAEPEVLKARAGKVRCGKCHEVFNALDHLLKEALPTASPAPAMPAGAGFALRPPAAPAAPVSARMMSVEGPVGQENRPAAIKAAVVAEPTAELAAPASAAAPLPKAPAAAPIDVPASGRGQKPVADISFFHAADSLPGEPQAIVAPQPPRVTVTAAAAATATEVDAEAEANEAEANVEAATQAEAAPANPPPDPLFEAQAAGLVAARDSRELPGYSKWAEGTLSAPAASFDEPHKTGWLAVVMSIILALMLLVQVVHYWRMEIANRWPEIRPWLEEACRAANCTVPYARDASQINLEASELQIDPTRGDMLVLNLTLKNRAPFAQQFPALELSLTDLRDNVVVRRILGPNDWLPPNLDAQASPAGKNPASTPPAFPANKEIAARLWIDAKDSGAVGYRLFVFYP